MFSVNSIKESLSKFFHINTLTDNLSGYVEARIELLKLEIREDVAKAFTKAILFGVIILLGFLFIVFLSLGLALFLNQYFRENFAGFWLVGGFYLILFIVSLALRKQLFQSLEHTLKNRLKKVD